MRILPSVTYCIYVSVFCMLCLIACKHEPAYVTPTSSGNFPNEVGNIFINRCATAGCHNALSYSNAAGLLLDSWEHLFDGSINGAVVVPYSSDYSSLMYFINTDSTLGPVAVPTMPLNHAPLTKDEYLAMKKWIDDGAPDKNGNIAFSTEPTTRQKIYAIHQGCDMLAVIDAEKRVVMRYIPIGSKPYPESAIYTRISPDGKYAYVCFWYGNQVYKIDTHTDKVAGIFSLSNSFWSTMAISADGQKLALTNGDDFGLSVVNTATAEVQHFSNTGFVNPHGITANASFDTFYITSMFGNTIYKFSNGNTTPISIDGNALTTNSGSTPDPYEIIMSPDYSKYFVACDKSNEVRVFKRNNDGLAKVIPVGLQPRGMSVAKTMPYLFVSCMEDPGAGIFKGSVYVINYNTLELVKIIKGDFYQPHTIAVNELDNSLYIFNRNQNYDGPAPHHQGPCSGRNGYYQVYDLNTLTPKSSRRYEVLVDPFVSAIRF
jgi:DNA-binding beta-propeller fold protein YncE